MKLQAKRKSVSLRVNSAFAFGGHQAVNDVSAEFHTGELTVIVGPNGAGKTTYFNLLSGQLAASSGQVFSKVKTSLVSAHQVVRN